MSSAEHDVRNLMVERGQRTRRRPTWLNNTIDPKEANRSVQGHNPRVGLHSGMTYDVVQ